MGGFEVNLLLENLPLLPRECGITGNWWIYSGWVEELGWEIGVRGQRAETVEVTVGVASNAAAQPE